MRNVMNMNWKKSLVVVPLSLSLFVPMATNLAEAHTPHTESTANTSEAWPTVSTPGSELRSTLANLLSEHAYLAVETMRNGAKGSADFEASANALNNNTADLSKAIASVYGDEAGVAFEKMWSSHIGYFVDYVKATDANDEKAKQVALDKLSQYRQDFSKFLETATDKRLEAGALAEGLQMHVNQLIGAFDSYIAGDYEKAYANERESIGHMHMVAKGLSSAITNQFPEKFENTKAVTPAADLRSTLDYLLSEHAGLAVEAMQNGIDGSKDFDASVAALNANTDDLSAAIASVYGEDAGKAFKDMWSSHISYFVDYVKATGAKDEKAKKTALNALEQYRTDFSKFMEKATDGKVPSKDLAEGLQAHVGQLIGAFDSYVAKDYDNAYKDIRHAYGHMYEASKLLSGGIVTQFPEKFADNMPNEMPKTGLVNPMVENSMDWTWILIGLLTMAAATGFVLRKQHKDA